MCERTTTGPAASSRTRPVISSERKEEVGRWDADMAQPETRWRATVYNRAATCYICCFVYYMVHVVYGIYTANISAPLCAVHFSYLPLLLWLFTIIASIIYTILYYAILPSSKLSMTDDSAMINHGGSTNSQFRSLCFKKTTTIFHSFSLLISNSFLKILINLWMTRNVNQNCAMLHRSRKSAA